MGGRNRSRAGRAVRNVVVRLLDDDERVLRRFENVEPTDVHNDAFPSFHQGFICSGEDVSFQRLTT